MVGLKTRHAVIGDAKLTIGDLMKVLNPKNSFVTADSRNTRDLASTPVRAHEAGQPSHVDDVAGAAQRDRGHGAMKRTRERPPSRARVEVAYSTTP